MSWIPDMTPTSLVAVVVTRTDKIIRIFKERRKLPQSDILNLKRLGQANRQESRWNVIWIYADEKPAFVIPYSSS